MWEAHPGGTCGLRVWMWALSKRWRQDSTIPVPLPNFFFLTLPSGGLRLTFVASGIGFFGLICKQNVG